MSAFPLPCGIVIIFLLFFLNKISSLLNTSENLNQTGNNYCGSKSKSFALFDDDVVIAVVLR